MQWLSKEGKQLRCKNLSHGKCPWSLRSLPAQTSVGFYGFMCFINLDINVNTLDH